MIWKRQIPLAITFFFGIAAMVPFYVPRYAKASDAFLNWVNIIMCFAFIVGIASLLMVHGGRILRLAPGWGYNAVLVASFLVTLFVGFYGGTDPGTFFDWIFMYVYRPLNATMYSLLAFFIASAAFRAFKAKTAEATLLLLTAFVVMLGRVPIGEYFWTQLHLDHVISLNVLIDKWIMGGFNAAGQRAILLGASVGLISMSLRLILGIERSYLGGD
jgi:hypothetical protein